MKHLTSYDVSKAKEFGKLVSLAVSRGYDLDKFLQYWVNSTLEEYLCVPHNDLDGRGPYYLLDEAENWHHLDSTCKTEDPSPYDENAIFFVGYALRLWNCIFEIPMKDLLEKIPVDVIAHYDGTDALLAYEEISHIDDYRHND